jgi:ankyrin repeat protein
MGEGQDPAQQAVDEFVAAAHGSLEQVQALLQKDPGLLNAAASWGETGIQAAAQTGQVEIARLLLESGAPLDICTAAMLGQAERVAEMLAGDPGLAHAVGAHKLPVLYYPAITGHRPTAEVLRAHGADINAGAGRLTPLHGAVVFDQPEMAAWLLECGANPGLLDSKGRTALDLAQTLGREQIAAALAAAKAAAIKSRRSSAAA